MTRTPDEQPALPDDVPQVPVPVPLTDVGGSHTSLPGEHRGGYQRALTEPVDLGHTVPSSPAEPEIRWAPAPPAHLPRIASWALTFAILGLVVSLFVGWGFLIGIVGIALAIVALRRPWDSRGVAIWALCLSLLSLAYSAGWLWWAASQGALFS